MNQIKIGKFIAKCRKKNNLTQMQLAEKLNITDRAISKWENGKGMPDSSIMLDLCNELKISVNELLCGELIEMNNYNEVAEKMLLEMAQYVPKYSQVYFAMHSGTTRYMKCPKCNKKSWHGKLGNSKVIAKFFNPTEVGTWYIIEGKLSELESIQLPKGKYFKRDILGNE